MSNFNQSYLEISNLLSKYHKKVLYSLDIVMSNFIKFGHFLISHLQRFIIEWLFLIFLSRTLRLICCPTPSESQVNYECLSSYQVSLMDVKNKYSLI